MRLGVSHLRAPSAWSAAAAPCTPRGEKFAFDSLIPLSPNRRESTGPYAAESTGPYATAVAVRSSHVRSHLDRWDATLGGGWGGVWMRCKLLPGGERIMQWQRAPRR